MRGLVGHPGEGDQPLFERWVTSPALDGDAFVADVAAPAPIDWLVVSGHGSNGGVWGDGSGDYAEINLSSAFTAHQAEARSGRLKCLMVPSCNNVHEDLAPAWLPLFNHDQPVYLVLGYHLSYAGGAIGAWVMAKFVDKLARNPSMPLVEAWQHANEAVRRTQPWAALVAKGAEGMNLEDWANGTLPTLSKVTELLHFNADHPAGKPAKLVDENYEVRWVMDDGTAIDMKNNLPGNAAVGLFDGRPGRISIRAKRASKAFRAGQEVFLFVYRYRPDKAVSVNDLLHFDADLLAPHPDMGQPVVTPVSGKAQYRDDILGFRIVCPADADVLELGFTVESSATKAFKPDGPGGTYGRFLLEFFHDYEFYELVDENREIIAERLDGKSYAATAGALLRP